MTRLAHIRIPEKILRSADEFRDYRQKNSDLLDERYRRELAVGTKQSSFSFDGLCGPCLRVTTFGCHVLGGGFAADGRQVPNWREQQACGCEFALNCRQRAMVHAVLSQTGTVSWLRAATLGPPDGVSAWFSKSVKSMTTCPRFPVGEGGGLLLPFETGALHLLLCPEQLHRVPQLDRALAEVARVLAPGGSFVFTIPFDYEAASTSADPSQLSFHEERGLALASKPVHRIGWDIIDRVCVAGFLDCTAHCFWSEELAYLGTFNFVFSAVR